MSTFILNRLANFIFKNLLNNIFDVDFMEPIKTVEYKEREMIFYDQNSFTIFSKTIKGDYNETEYEEMMKNEQELSVQFDDSD